VLDVPRAGVDDQGRLPSGASRTSDGWKSGFSELTKSKLSAVKLEPFRASAWRITLRVLCWALKRLPLIASGNEADSIRARPLSATAGNSASGGMKPPVTGKTVPLSGQYG
jgi:hypothetical protein